MAESEASNHATAGMPASTNVLALCVQAAEPFDRVLIRGRRSRHGGASHHADVNIELNEIAAASVPVLDRLTCPVRFVLATGDSLGTQDNVGRI